MNKLGVVINIGQNTNVLTEMEKLKKHHFECCQLVIWDMNCFTDVKAEEIKAAVAETGVEVSTLWAGWSGPVEWNFTGGPVTAGLVPPAYRMIRAEELIKAGEFAVKIGVSKVATHVGFLPENIVVKYIDYKIDRTSKKYVEGEKTRSKRDVTLRVKCLEENKELLYRCSNCGAPLNINLTSVCTYCGQSVDRNDSPYVIESIEIK